MKLSDYLPELPGFVRQQYELNKMFNNTEQLMKSADDSEMYRMPSLGIDNIYNTWVRQQMAYRQQLLSDLLSIALNTEEVRATITHIGNEVFRRGIKWKPKFSQKCEDCDVE